MRLTTANPLPSHFQLFWLVFTLVAPGAFAQSRPNILLLIGDNWLYDHAGVHG